MWRRASSLIAMTGLLLGVLLPAFGLWFVESGSRADPPIRSADAPSAFVSRAGRDFVLRGEPYTFVGANSYYLPYVSNFTVDDTLATASRNGFRVVRVWGFRDIGNRDWSNSVDPNRAWRGVFFQYWNGQAPAYNDGPNGLQRLDYVIHRAGQAGVHLVIPFTSSWYWQGGVDQYVRWRGGQYLDQFYTDPVIKQWYKDYVRHLLERVNTYSGIAYEDDPTILSWQLVNEPGCHGNGPHPVSRQCTAGTLVDWVAEMSAYVKSIDRNHLVGVGDAGVYCEPGAAGWAEDCSGGVDTLALGSLDTIDYVGFHLYADQHKKDTDWGTTWIARRVADAHSFGKPVLMDEFGHSDPATRGAVYRTWLQAFFAAGGNGALFWQLAGHGEDGRPWEGDEYTVACPSDVCAAVRAAGQAMRSAR